jgi:hypothetical protein
MKKIITFLLLPIMAFTLITCKNNNEEEQGEKGKLVKTVELYQENLNAYYLYTFYYDNLNRLTKVHFTIVNYTGNDFWSERELNYAYKKNSITLMSCVGDEDGQVDCIETTYLLDNNGYCTQYGDGKNIAKFTYENGYLKTSKSSHNGGIKDECSYFWENGNMKTQSGIYTTENGTNSTYECNAEYSNKENLLNIRLFDPLPSLTDYNWLEFIKFKGIASKNYLVKTINQYTTNIYNYEFDTDGYPIQIIVNGIENLKITLTYY